MDSLIARSLGVFVFIATLGVLVFGCKKDPPVTQSPSPAETIAASAPVDVPAKKPAAAPGAEAQGKSPEPQIVESEQQVEPEPAGATIDGEAPEPSEALEKAADTTRELALLLSKMLQDMKPHEEDTGKLAEIQERYRPAIDETLKRGQGFVKALTQGEKILLQQHGIAMLQEISEDFVGLPAEVVVPVADELLGLVGVETEHTFD